METKEAVKLAIDHLRDLFESDVEGMPKQGDFRLEEIRSSESDGWIITISFIRKSPEQPPKAVKTNAVFGQLGAAAAIVKASTVIVGIDANREYKVVEIAADGKVKSVTMRTIPVSAA